MKAYDFQYGEHCLHDFNMMICQFDVKGLNTVSNGSKIVFNTISSSGGSKHNLVSTEYEDCLTTTIQICKNYCNSDVKEITSTEFRELTQWLNRKRFLKFKILSEDYIDLYFEASFNVSRVEIDGKLIGLEGNRRLGNDIIVGVFYIMSEDDEGNLVSLSEKKIQYYTKLFWEPEKFDRTDIETSLSCRFF